MNGYVLAIDLGTTGITVLIFNHDGELCSRSYSEFHQYYPQTGWVEHDAEEIWQVALSGIRQALKQKQITPAQIRCMGITNQRETAVLWQRSNSKSISPAIVWQDRRTSNLCQQLKQEGLEPEWQQKTGLRIDPYFSATKIHWLLQQNSEWQRQAENGELAFGTIDTWMIWKLSGGTCHATDYSNASRTLLYNIHQLDWDDEILRRLQIPRAILPAVKPSSGFFAETDPQLFSGQRIPICGVAGDQQAALFGQGCHTKGMAKNTYGTGSFLLMHSGQQATISKNKLLTTIAWRIGNEPVEYALEGSIFVTGAAIQWLRDGLGIIKQAAETDALASSLNSNDDVYFVPALTGLGAPHWDPYARGVIIGLTRGSTRQHLVRAALEGIAYQVCDVVKTMQREAAIDLQEIRADGGMVVNNFLMQFQADILGVPLKLPSITETTALGAAYLAGLGCGFWNNRADLAALWQLARRYRPEMEREQAQRLYARWQQAVALSRGWAQQDS
ncbi:MAG: glycerol kinase [Desulfobacteraceae bacterium 4572_35.1]|nr:MAG: glycerol kinase [Desulfobacteraceae bacterium 4572_35.1]